MCSLPPTQATSFPGSSLQLRDFTALMRRALNAAVAKQLFFPTAHGQTMAGHSYSVSRMTKD